jgi:hypothetical protein
MKTARLKLGTNDVNCVVSYLNDYLPFHYHYTNDGVIVLTDNSHRITHRHPLENSVILKKGLQYLEIDIIEGDITTNSIVHHIYKPTSHFIDTVKVIFDRFCDEFIVMQKSELLYSA